jgi:hypothetical protein
MREIVYSETRCGVFEPVPTRSAKRAETLRLKKQKEHRRERIENVLGIIGLGAVICLIVFGAWLEAGGWRYL